jgi:hypothetical protein
MNRPGIYMAEMSATEQQHASEAQISRSILDYLAARHILAFRMQVGAFSSEYKGKQRFMRVGTPGMADILAFKHRKTGFLATPAIIGDYTTDVIVPIWIEVKDFKGKQSEFQKSFQSQVEEHGHMYIVARSLDDVKEALR